MILGSVLPSTAAYYCLVGLKVLILQYCICVWEISLGYFLYNIWWTEYSLFMFFHSHWFLSGEMSNLWSRDKLPEFKATMGIQSQLYSTQRYADHIAFYIMVMCFCNTTFIPDEMSRWFPRDWYCCKNTELEKIDFELVFKASKVTLKFFLPGGGACLFLFPSFMT